MPTRIPDSENVFYNWACDVCGSQSVSETLALECEERCRQKRVENAVADGVPISQVEAALDDLENNPPQHTEPVVPQEEPTVHPLAPIRDDLSRMIETLAKGPLRPSVCRTVQSLQLARSVCHNSIMLDATEMGLAVATLPVDAAIEAMEKKARV